MISDPRNFLPEKYRHYLKNNEKIPVYLPKKEKKSTQSPVKKQVNNSKLISLFIVLFLIIGVYFSLLLSQQTQDFRQQAATDPYPSLDLAKTSQATNFCDSGWYVCNVGCCGVGGTPTDGKRYSLIIDSVKCSDNSNEGCVDGHFTWYYDDDLSKKPEIQYAITTELEARGFYVVNGEVKKIVTPTPIVTASLTLTATPTTSPSPTITVSSSPAISPIPTKPVTKSDCNSQGSWFNDTCYLYWEVLPGGTHVVVPPNTINDYQYATFQSVATVESYTANLVGITKSENLNTEQTISASPTQAAPTILKTDPTTEYQSGNFFNQLDDRWKNIYIDENIKFGNVGCGVVSVANLTGVSPDQVLELYEIGSAMGITANGTGIEANAKALEELGYQTSLGVNGNGVLEDEIRKANAYNDYNEVIDEINNYQEKGGWQIMLNGNFGNLDGGGHWVVVKNVDITNNTVTVIDPNGGELKEYVLDVSGNSGNDNAITPKRLLLAKNN